MNEIETRGGASVGWVSSSWPFASLFVSAKELSLKVAVAGTYNFKKEQIISIDKHLVFPILAWGIKIRHNVESYPEQIIFYTFRHPKNLIDSISKTGFVSEGHPNVRTQSPDSRKRGMPVRIVPLVIVIALWNILFIVDQAILSEVLGKPVVFGVVALPLVFITSLLIKSNAKLAGLFLKPGRHIGEITPMLNLLIFVSGLMSLGLSAMLLMGGQ